MLVSYMENKNCKDQIFLLLYEAERAETLYCLLVDRGFSMELKLKVLKVRVDVTYAGAGFTKELCGSVCLSLPDVTPHINIIYTREFRSSGMSHCVIGLQFSSSL